MARIKCPSNVSSITLTTSGVLTPDSAGIITCNSVEATALSFNGSTAYNRKGCATQIDTDSSGNIGIAFPSVVSSITINAIVYTVNGAVLPFGTTLSARVPAPAASQFLYQNFSLVNG